MHSLPSVLIFTYPEHGQANVNVATAYELALAGVNVYFASFVAVRDRILRLQELIDRHASRSGGRPTGSIVFQECTSLGSYAENLQKRGVTQASFPHPPGVYGALKSFSKVDVVLLPWSRGEYVAGIKGIKEMIGTIKPNMVVIDGMFYPARDACRLLGQKYIVIRPNSIKDIAMNAQPWALWKYPMISSGFPFPLRWWQIPLNIYLSIRLATQLMTSVHFKQIRALRSSLGLKSMFAGRPQPGVTHLCPALAETDFPFAVMPREILLCGPIVMPFDPLEESDPVLAKWLDNGPTVVINRGSHVVSDARFVREVSSAIRMMLDYHDRKGLRKVQVLWKVKPNGDIQSGMDDIIGKEVRDGKVKVLAWLDPEPVSILQHPNVVCTIHHGGANSFFEGVWSGVPHVVLPVWLDTYDYAHRAEYLNIGIYGNKTCAPGVHAEELGKALVRVTAVSEEAAGFRAAAQRLKELCRAKGNGRELSAAAIMREAGISN